MAKKKFSQKGKEEKKTHDFPSDYGSHASMVNEDLSSQLPKNSNLVVLTDQNGHYLTEKSRLDSHMADPNRYADVEWRMTKLAEAGVDPKKKVQRMDSQAVQASNVKGETNESVKADRESNA